MTTDDSHLAPDTRERILDAAEQLFARHGFAGTSVREITDAAHANLGAVNYYFRSKENLYLEIFTRLATLFREPILAAGKAAESLAPHDPDGAFRLLGRAFLTPRGNSDACQPRTGLFAREAVEACLPPGLMVREFVVPAIETITNIVQRTRPALSEATARACAHSFFAQLMHVWKAARVIAVTEDDQLDHAVRFTVAAILHVEDAPSERSGRKAQTSPSPGESNG